eukprot:gene6285-2916_t
MPRLSLVNTLVVICTALCARQASALDFAYEFSIVSDGTAASKDGMVMPSSTGPTVAAKFIRDYVANNGVPGATDYQMDIFRDKALAFFAERFGVNPLDPFLPDFDEPIMVSEDSMIVPMLMDRSHNNRISILRAKLFTRYIPDGEALIGGYYLVVGNSGLPSAGTYQRALDPGMTSGFGMIVVLGICPVARQIVMFACTGKGGTIGNLRVEFQNDIPNSVMLDRGWETGLGLPAQMHPILMTANQYDKDRAIMWGEGSCTGMFYAAPKEDKTFNIMSSIVCNFGAAPNYNGFHNTVLQTK